GYGTPSDTECCLLAVILENHYRDHGSRNVNLGSNRSSTRLTPRSLTRSLKERFGFRSESEYSKLDWNSQAKIRDEGGIMGDEQLFIPAGTLYTTLNRMIKMLWI